MMLFCYEAIGTDGRLFHGEIQAASLEAAIGRLRRDGALPVKVEPGRRRLSVIAPEQRALRPDIAATLFAGLADLLKAGLLLDQALNLLASTGDSAALRRLAARLHDRIEGGEPLSFAMEAMVPHFDPTALAMVRAGEEGGTLHDVLARLATLAQRQKCCAHRRHAFSHALMLLATCALGFILFAFLPQIMVQFQEPGRAMPDSLRWLSALREWIAGHGSTLIMATGLALVLGHQLGRRPAFVRRWHRGLLKLPVVGTPIALGDIARFAQTLATMLESGVPLARALPLARRTLANRVLADAIGETIQAIRSGRSLSAALALTRDMPPVVGQLLRSGGQAKEPAAMLQHLARLCECEAGRCMRGCAALRPTVLIFAFGALAGGLLSMLLGAWPDINQLAV